MTVRRAGPADAPALAGVETACFSQPWSQQALADTLGQKGALFVLAEREGTVVGYAGCQCVLDEGYITNIAVVPSARRQGIARQMLQTLLEQAEKEGLSFVTLEVRQSNRAAIELYRKLGFEPVGVRKRYYTDPVEDAQLWTVKLGEKKSEYTGH